MKNMSKVALDHTEKPYLLNLLLSTIELSILLVTITILAINWENYSQKNQTYVTHDFVQ